MNITANTATETQAQQPNVEQTSAKNADKVSASSKLEEKKDEKVTEKQGEFKKVLDEQKEADKAVQEQQAIPVQNQNLSLNEQIANKFAFDTVSGLRNIKQSYNYETINISKEDAKFFIDLVENKQFALQQSGDKNALIRFSDEIGPTYKAQQTSNILTDLINKAYNDQKPVRIDFDNNVSVILKIDNKGKVTAEFIPGDKAVEAYLRNNIGYLKQRFDDQNLPYNDLMYRQSNQNRERRQNQQNNKGE